MEITLNTFFILRLFEPLNWSNVLLRLEPVTDLTSAATVDSRNCKKGFLVFYIELTNVMNLLSSISMKLLPVISSRIQRCVGKFINHLDGLIPGSIQITGALLPDHPASKCCYH